MLSSNLSHKRHSSVSQEHLPGIGNFLARFTIGCELFLLLCLAAMVFLPVSSLSASWQPIGLITITVLWFISWRINHKISQPYGQGTWPLYHLLAWLPINLLIMTPTTSSWQACGYLLFGITLFLSCRQLPWFAEEPVRLTLLLVMIGGGLIFSAPLVQWKSEFRLFYLPLYDWLALLDLPVGERIHANVLAGALVLLLHFVVAFALTPARSCRVMLEGDGGQKKKIVVGAKQKWAKVIQFAGLLLSLLILTLIILTQSRGGYISAGVAIFFVCILRWPLLNYALPLIAVGGLLFIQQTGIGPLLTLVGADNTFGGSEVRTIIWSTSLQAFVDFGWTGIGIGAFRQVMPLLYPNPVIANEVVTHAHNLLLQIGLDLGLPGLAAYLILYLTMIGMSVAVLRRTHSPHATAKALGADWEDHTLIAPPEVGVTVSTKRFIREVVHLERTRQQHWTIAAGCLAALVGMQVHGLLDAVTWGNKLAFIPWLIFAQITLLYRYYERPSDSTEA